MKSYPHWDAIQEEFLKLRPVIPSFDSEEDNTERWKFLSAQQKGFDLCCSFFQIKE